MKRQFFQNAPLFRRFDPNSGSATSFTVPKNAPVVFLR
jgi:hypothetical protein